MTTLFALVDIHRQHDGALPEERIRLAYAASRRARIALLLDGIAPAEIDRVLDPLVAAGRLDIPGLIYLDAPQSPAGAEMDFQLGLSDRIDWGCPSGRRPASPEPTAADGVLRRLAYATRLDEMIAS